MQGGGKDMQGVTEGRGDEVKEVNMESGRSRRKSIYL